MPSASNVAEVEAIKERFTSSSAALLTEYRGLKVSELGELRAMLRGSATEYKVLKNTLTSIAAGQAGLDGLTGMLEGPTAVAFVRGDVVQAAKDLSDFARTHQALLIKGGVLDGKILGADEVRRLATLESREVLLTKLAGMLKGQLQQAVNVLAAPLRQVATMSAALRDRREAEGGPAADAAAEPAAPEAAVATEEGPTVETAAPEPAAPEVATAAPEPAAPDAAPAATTPEITPAVTADDVTPEAGAPAAEEPSTAGEPPLAVTEQPEPPTAQPDPTDEAPTPPPAEAQ